MPAAAARSASAIAAREQCLGVADEHERGVGKPQRAAGLLQQRDAGLALEHRELLRHRRRRELQRVGDGRHGPALVQLPEQAQAAEVEHDEAMLQAELEKAVSILVHRTVTMKP